MAKTQTNTKPNAPTIPEEEIFEEQNVRPDAPAWPEYVPDPSLPMPVQVWFDLQPNLTGKTHRLLAYQRSTWDPINDRTLGRTIDEGRGAIDMMAKFSTGYVQGTPSFIITAPIGTLFSPNSNGTFGYVHHTFKIGEPFSVKFEGKDVPIIIDEMDIPMEGYRRLDVVGGSLVGNNEDDAWISETGTFLWGYLQTAQGILMGLNVAASAGPALIDRARDALAVTEDAEPKAAFEAYRLAHRQAKRLHQNAIKNAPLIQRELKKNGGAADPASFMVPLFPEGTFSLKGWPSQAPITLRNGNGNLIRSDWIRDDSDAARIAFAGGVREEGLFIDLSQ